VVTVTMREGGFGVSGDGQPVVTGELGNAVLFWAWYVPCDELHRLLHGRRR
jgi:hypothetical protein